MDLQLDEAMTDASIERPSDPEIRTHKDSPCTAVPDLDDICFEYALFTENIFDSDDFEELCSTENDHEESTYERITPVAIPKRKRKPVAKSTRKLGKRAKQAVGNDSIQAVFSSECVKKCLNKFTSADVLEKRTSFWDKDRDAQRQYIMSQLEATFNYQEQDACNIMFTIEGFSVCQKCWRQIFAISKSRYYNVLSDVKKGQVTARPDHRKDLCYDTKRFLEAKLWLTRFTRRFGDPMPHRIQVQLPSTLTKSTIWQEYQEEFNVNGSPCLKYNRFLEMWTEHFHHVVIPKCKDFTQCKDCVDFQTAMLSQPSKEEQKDLKEGLKAHLNLQSLSREKYYRHISKARNNPEKYSSIIIDNMDQQKSSLPAFPRQSKADVGLTRMKHHVTGVLDHGNDKSYAYVWNSALPGDSNVTCTVLLTVLLKIAQRNGGGLPEVLYLQGDNSPKDNKNVTVLYFLGYLVKLKLVKKVKLNFLMVGHTHEDIDQMFSKFSQALHHTSAPTVGKLLDVLKSAYRPENSHSELLRSVWDFRAMFTACDGLKGHSIPHVFKIYMKGSQLTLAYKDWPLPSEVYREIPMNLTGVNPQLAVVRPMCSTVNEIKTAMFRDLPKWKDSARLQPSEIDDWERYLQSLSTTIHPEVEFNDFDSYNAVPTEDGRLPENLMTALQKSQRKMTRKSKVSVQRKRRTQ